MEDYSKYYDLNSYLFNEVSRKYQEQGYIYAFDFFCIIIWKANRAKTNIFKKITKIAKSYDLNKICEEITVNLYDIKANEEKLRYLIEHWQFGIPMASAILSVLFPDDFTVYDVRVCQILKKHGNLINKTNIEGIITGYFEYVKDVIDKIPKKKTLREKDVFLWGESFFLELTQDIKDGFTRLEKSKLETKKV
ncbi:hypothetical protein LCGC14_1544040 [marine sediment metagenome]|uniref:Uncharacterized protein n=1 Tax=marine sediment metagenome TaxID=412755 RepID=A0A0F9L8A5_9ZZZZ